MSAASPSGTRRRVCVIGSGMHFVSGISYYTYFLTKALQPHHDVSVILMRRLVPQRFYPGRDRVGTRITDLHTSQLVPTFDGIDWYAVPSLGRAVRFLRRHRPEIVVLQWWTGSSLPSYLVLERAVRAYGGTTLIEFHEDLDTAELRVPVLPSLVAAGLRRLIRRSGAYVVHSEHDAVRIGTRFGLPRDRTWVIPHGPYAMAAAPEARPGVTGTADQEGGTSRAVSLLFFGTIRPYKGLEVLVDAFDELAGAEPGRWHLQVVGEVWEGHTLPLTKIEASPHRRYIDLRTGYVPDDDLGPIFAAADLVVLPYLRAAASGPLQLTMTAGLPVVVSSVGGLTEAVQDYAGAVLVAPGDPHALAEAIRMASGRIGSHFADPHSWETVARRFDRCFDSLGGPGPSALGV